MKNGEGDGNEVRKQARESRGRKGEREGEAEEKDR